MQDQFIGKEKCDAVDSACFDYIIIQLSYTSSSFPTAVTIYSRRYSYQEFKKLCYFFLFTTPPKEVMG